MSQRRPFSKDAAIALLLAGLFILILAIISLDSTDSIYISHDNGIADPSNKPIDLINKHLREVYDRQEIQKKNAENLNILTAPPIYHSPHVEPVYNFDNIPLSFDQDSINELIGKDLGTMAHPKSLNPSLNEQIQEEVINDINQKIEAENKKKNLAEAIIKRAKDYGYSIEVDDDYKVKSVKKIKKNEAPSIFDPNALPNR